VELIHHTAMELTELVDDLLDLSKAQAGKMGVHVTTYEVGSIFGGLRVMLRPLTRSDAVELSFESVEELPPMTSDASKVSLILRNLISNALKFTTHGSVRVSATLLPSDRIRFVVADTGVGIHPRDHERIFEEFSQVENPLQGGVKGTGLGLALVRRLAQMLGGEVSVESELGQGSTFTVELPRVLEDPAHEPGTSAPPASLNRSQTPAFRAAPRKRRGPPRILVMDDDPSARHVLTHHLRRADCIVLQAEDGARGLWMARRELPDLIFMDLEMPALSGWEVLPQLRNEKETRHIPVVIYTGMDTDEDVVPHLDAQGLLLKQGDLAELGSRAMELVRSFVPVDEDEVGPRA
jgi:CheY-like chemotaxis protein